MATFSVEVPAVATDGQACRNARVVANSVVSWTDDLYSVRKETAQGTSIT
ncbi:hypothetical protein ACWD4L_49830 [Streptomyces sp. NPDC002596]